MTVNSPLYEALRRIREAQIPAADREMLRPAFAAMEAGQVMRACPRSSLSASETSMRGCRSRNNKYHPRRTICMFSLLMAKTKIIAVTVVSELCGKERRHGCSIKFEMKSNNWVLTEFNSQLRHALYEHDDAPKQPALEGVEDEMLGLTRLKFPKLGMPLKYDWEGAGYELHLHIGASGRDDIVLDDVGLSNFQFQCNEGGSVITTFKAMTRPTTQQQGRIDHMLQLETELSLKPPSTKQRELAA